MHLQILHGIMPADIKWRGVALYYFDGRRWWNHQPDTALVRPLHNLPLDLSQLRVQGLPLSSVAGPVTRTFTLTFFFSSRRRHTRSLCDWSSDVCSSDLGVRPAGRTPCGRGTSRRRSRRQG